jgi:hypothetical protein
VSIKPPLEGSYAFVYVHKTKGIIRVGDIRNAEQIESSGSWKHVSTINAHVALEEILRATIKDRNKIIKHLLK